MTAAVAWLLRLITDAVVAREHFKRQGIALLPSVRVVAVSYYYDAVTVEWCRR